MKIRSLRPNFDYETSAVALIEAFCAYFQIVVPVLPLIPASKGVSHNLCKPEKRAKSSVQNLQSNNKLTFKRLSSKTTCKVGVRGRRFMPRKPVYSGGRHEYAFCNAVRCGRTTASNLCRRVPLSTGSWNKCRSIETLLGNPVFKEYSQLSTDNLPVVAACCPFSRYLDHGEIQDLQQTVIGRKD